MLLLLAAAALASDGVPTKPACDPIVPAVHPGWACVGTAHGLVIAASRERADQLATLATTGEGRFRTRFDADIPSYAVVEMRDGAVDSVLDTTLMRQGVELRLPWLSEGAMAEALKASIIRAVTAKAEAMRLGPDETSALVQSALAQQAPRRTSDSLRAKEAGALPHELGHVWFSKSFWADATARAGDHYGGPAPDWMDETAAVLMEDDALANSRRRQFRQIYDGGDAEAKARLVDLTLFLSGGHPALPKIDLKKIGVGVTVLTGDEAAKIGASALTFYLQARTFADYVFARSGDPAAFRSAAEAFSKGKSTADWLKTSGARLHLPASVAELQIDWEAWLRLPVVSAETI